MQKLRTHLSNIKYAYIIAYIVCFSLQLNVYVNCYASDILQFVFQAFAVLGVIIILVDFFTCGVMFTVKGSSLLLLFNISCLISILINFKYNLFDNLKVLCWMLVQSFVIMSVDSRQTIAHHKKFFRIITEAFSLIWFVEAAWSMIMFFTGYGSVLVNNDYYKRIGFIEGRLFGVFTDPNYAAICVIFSMLMLIAIMHMHKDSKLAKIYHIIVLIVDYLFVLMTRSRTANICLTVALVLISFLLARRYFGKLDIKKSKKLINTIGATVICVIFGVLLTSGVNSSLDKIYITINSDQTNENGSIEDELIRPDVEYSTDISNNRIEIWADYLEVFKQKPILGTGPLSGIDYADELLEDSYVAETGYSYHNGYLAVLVGTGLIGTLIMVAYIFTAIKSIFSYLIKKAEKPDEIYIPVILLTALLSVGAISALPLMAVFFNNSVLEVVFWFVLGYILTMIRISQNQNEPEKEIAYKLSSIFRMKHKKHI